MRAWLLPVRLLKLAAGCVPGSPLTMSAMPDSGPNANRYVCVPSPIVAKPSPPEICWHLVLPAGNRDRVVAGGNQPDRVRGRHRTLHLEALRTCAERQQEQKQCRQRANETGNHRHVLSSVPIDGRAAPEDATRRSSRPSRQNNIGIRAFIAFTAMRRCRAIQRRAGQPSQSRRCEPIDCPDSYAAGSPACDSSFRRDRR